MNHTCAQQLMKGIDKMLAFRMGVTSAVLASCALLCLAFSATSGAAEFGFENFSVRETDSAGVEISQAGSHPDLHLELDLNMTTTSSGGSTTAGQLETAITELPVGLYGDPTAVPACSPAGFHSFPTCPDESQVGVLTLLPIDNPSTFSTPLYNVEPSPGTTAVFAANVIEAPVKLAITVMPDGRVRTTLRHANGGVGFSGVYVDIWGVPADPAHDPQRGPSQNDLGHSSGALPMPLLTAPSNCNASRETTMRIASWQDPADFVEATDADAKPTGCELLEFNPSMKVRPDEQQASTPSAFNFDLTSPQDLDPESLGTPPIREVAVKLPQGVALSPAAASGLTSCSDEQLGLGSEAAPTCPDGSKVGSVSVDTPVLADPLSGSVYLRPPTKDAMVRPVIVVNGPGILLKLPGTVQTDSATGQLTAIFSDLPQLPFSEMHLRFKGGPRAPMITPAACGPQTTQVTFTAWSGQVVNDSSSFNNGSGGSDCAAKFSPQLSAGSVNPIAGAKTPFVLRLQRESGEGAFKDVTVHLPEGLSAYLKGVPYCPQSALTSISNEFGAGAAQIAGPSCPSASKVGSVTVGAGAGSNPFYLQTGKAYLAGPYKGAPLSLAIVAPAVAGPFDLGNVVVRTALRVNPTTAEITAVSDPLPSMLQGVPLQLRDLQVNLDRPDFTVNPTSCKPMAVTAELESTEGQTAGASDHYQVANCADLGFKPKLSLKFTGATHRSAHPALRAVLKARKGDANIGKATVTLPGTEQLENEHIRTICTRVQYAADNCPKGSIYGYAKAWTPLLAKPLQGPVYLRSSSHTLPDLVASLDGQIHIDLAGRIDSPGGKIRNTFWALPDAPVSKFVLTMQGGKKGLLVNNTELCAVNPRAEAEFTGQNGKRSASSPLVKLDCGKSPRKR